MSKFDMFINELSTHGFRVEDFNMSAEDFKNADQGVSKTATKGEVTVTISKPEGVDSFLISTSKQN